MRILTALDHSEYAEIVLEHGLDHAAREPGAELHFVTVIGPGEDVVTARHGLEDLVREDLDAFDLVERPIVLHVRQGHPAAEIAALANELGVDLLVVGQFGVPSTSEALLAMAHVPTEVVGLEGTVVDAQCSACMRVRRESSGRQLFCEAHTSDRLPDLVTRLPPSSRITSPTLW
jgi:nucleotide-binding universal stress UspA family protein